MTYWDIVKMAEKWLMTYPQHRKSADGGDEFRQFVASEVGGDEWSYGSQHALRLARLNMDLGQRGYCPPESKDASYRIFYGDMPWECDSADCVFRKGESSMNENTPIWPSDAQILQSPEPEDNAPDALIDDIRSEFRKHGWAGHMLTDAMLLDTVRSALTRYDEMQTAINGMVETVQGLRDANAPRQVSTRSGDNLERLVGAGKGQNEGTNDGRGV